MLGDAATDEVLTAWAGYWFLADVLIAREKTIYGELASAPGGWNDWREFTVERTEPESEIIRSFYLVPSDGGPVMRHRPGQYLPSHLTFPERGGSSGTIQFPPDPTTARTGSASSGKRDQVCRPAMPRTGSTTMRVPERSSAWLLRRENSSWTRRAVARWS